MRRLRLTPLLILANVGLLLLAAAGVAWLANQYFAQTSVDPTLARAEFLRDLAIVALAAVALMAGANALIGWRLGQALNSASTDLARIGFGDLARPRAGPPAPLAGEVETLTTTLEDMRARLLSLMADLR